MLIRDAKGRKKEASKQGHTNNKAKQHNTPKAAVTFPKKNELPHVHVYTCTCSRSLYILCRLMRGRIKVADPRIYLVPAAYIHIREEVVDEYQTIT